MNIVEDLLETAAGAAYFLLRMLIVLAVFVAFGYAAWGLVIWLTK